MASWSLRWQGTAGERLLVTVNYAPEPEPVLRAAAVRGSRQRPVAAARPDRRRYIRSGRQRSAVARTVPGRRSLAACHAFSMEELGDRARAGRRSYTVGVGGARSSAFAEATADHRSLGEGGLDPASDGPEGPPPQLENSEPRSRTRGRAASQ